MNLITYIRKGETMGRVSKLHSKRICLAQEFDAPSKFSLETTIIAIPEGQWAPLTEFLVC